MGSCYSSRRNINQNIPSHRTTVAKNRPLKKKLPKWTYDPKKCRPISICDSSGTLPGSLFKDEHLSCVQHSHNLITLSSSRLEKMRSEFWDTAPAFEGRIEIWDALHAACTAIDSDGDFTLAQAIIDGANITLPKGTLSECYDELGNRYKIPSYCITPPVNYAPYVTNTHKSGGLGTPSTNIIIDSHNHISTSSNDLHILPPPPPPDCQRPSSFATTNTTTTTDEEEDETQANHVVKLCHHTSPLRLEENVASKKDRKLPPHRPNNKSLHPYLLNTPLNAAAMDQVGIGANKNGSVGIRYSTTPPVSLTVSLDSRAMTSVRNSNFLHPSVPGPGLVSNNSFTDLLSSNMLKKHILDPIRNVVFGHNRRRNRRINNCGSSSTAVQPTPSSTAAIIGQNHIQNGPITSLGEVPAPRACLNFKEPLNETTSNGLLNSSIEANSCLKNQDHLDAVVVPATSSDLPDKSHSGAISAKGESKNFASSVLDSLGGNFAGTNTFNKRKKAQETIENSPNVTLPPLRQKLKVEQPVNLICHDHSTNQSADCPTQQTRVQSVSSIEKTKEESTSTKRDSKSKTQSDNIKPPFASQKQQMTLKLRIGTTGRDLEINCHSNDTVYESKRKIAKLIFNCINNSSSKSTHQTPDKDLCSETIESADSVVCTESGPSIVPELTTGRRKGRNLFSQFGQSSSSPASSNAELMEVLIGGTSQLNLFLQHVGLPPNISVPPCPDLLLQTARNIDLGDVLNVSIDANLTIDKSGENVSMITTGNLPKVPLETDESGPTPNYNSNQDSKLTSITTNELNPTSTCCLQAKNTELIVPLSPKSRNAILSKLISAQKWLLAGKVMNNKCTLQQAKIPRGFIIQVAFCI